MGEFWRRYGPWLSPWQMMQGFAAIILLGLAKILPSRLASDAGSLIARSVGPLLPWHKRGLDNLAHVYPDMPERERRQIMRGVWDNLGRTMGEFGRISSVRSKVTVSGLENMPPAGTPTIFVTAHMANWEALTEFSRLSGRDLLNIYRRPNNVYVDKILKQRTAGLNINLVEKSNRVGIPLMKQLRKGDAVTLFVDQKGTHGDVLVPFLGKDAITIRTPALLAAKTGAVIVPGRMIRKGRHDLHIDLCPPLAPVTETGPDAERAVMTAINDIVSSWVEDTPEQWLWIHRRWKNADTFAADDAARQGTPTNTSVQQPSSA